MNRMSISVVFTKLTNFSFSDKNTLLVFFTLFHIVIDIALAIIRFMIEL